VSDVIEEALNMLLKKTLKELEKVSEIVDASPAVEIYEIRIKAQAIMEKHGKDYKTINKLIEPLAKREKECFKIAKKQNMKMYNKQSDLMIKVSSIKEKIANNKYRLGL